MSSTKSESVLNEPDYETVSQKIIVEVQKRPALYDTTLRQYSERITKNKLWEEVYLHVVDNWMTLSEAEKKKTGSTIQKKWKNMRDSFAKELAMQRGKSGQGAIKKRKYIHFDSMLFLVPTLQKRETSSNIKPTSQDHPDIDLSDLPPANSVRAPSSKKASKSQSKNDDYEQRLLYFLNTKQNMCEYDEDISFSQMIVPMLRKLNDDQKHFAKVEIMNILHNAKSFCRFEPPIHSQASRSNVSFTQTPSPQSSCTYSPLQSPTMPLQSPVSTPMAPTPSVKKKPHIIHQQIISTEQQTSAQFATRTAKQNTYLPLNTTLPSTSKAPVHSLQELEQPELCHYEQNDLT